MKTSPFPIIAQTAKPLNLFEKAFISLKFYAPKNDAINAKSVDAISQIKLFTRPTIKEDLI